MNAERKSHMGSGLYRFVLDWVKRDRDPCSTLSLWTRGVRQGISMGTRENVPVGETMRPSERPALQPGGRSDSRRQARPRGVGPSKGGAPQLLTYLLIAAVGLFLFELAVGVAAGRVSIFGLFLSLVWTALIVCVIKRSEGCYKAARFIAYIGLVLNTVVVLTSLVELGASVSILFLGVKVLKIVYNAVILYLFPQPTIRDWVLYG
jgi:hypothetical protein